ncbi:unnamed protein product [Thelazia callipaeda]|uniref:Pyruvate kinase n=1 Tax=Thelazia callipaeda TaxID=103827 RepID=A0A158RAN7_THECL|nr:unnamed protein product [Thelazia callipaeda]
MSTNSSKRKNHRIYSLSIDNSAHFNFRTRYEYRGTQLEHLSELDIGTPLIRQRKTGIICTIGPACCEIQTLTNMIEKGMTVTRLNFSHGTHKYHAQLIENIRKACSSLNVNSIAIALDTKGPEIRTGILIDNNKDEIAIVKDSFVKLTTDTKYKDRCDSHLIFVDYPNITKVVQENSRIFINDGLISLVVKEIYESSINCIVEIGGMLGNQKGVNIPGATLDLPYVTDKDIEDLKFGVEQNVDFIFASFTRAARGIEIIRDVLGEKGKHIKIIAKIENEEGIRRLEDSQNIDRSKNDKMTKNFRADEIIDAADGIMVARGDLGIEISASKVFLVQKMLIAKCNRAGKPVICATQMLESMVGKPRPTRAESSDVANAVLDGVDCVMLSSETAKGNYPLESLMTMHEICKEAETAFYYTKYFEELLRLVPKPTDDATTIAIAATSAVESCRATAIICVTVTGRTAELLSQWRPPVPIIAVCENSTVVRQLHLWRGVFPLHFEGWQILFSKYCISCAK